MILNHSLAAMYCDVYPANPNFKGKAGSQAPVQQQPSEQRTDKPVQGSGIRPQATQH